MALQSLDDGPELVAAVRRAAALHNATWEAMVPDHFTIDLRAEAAEERAFIAMATEKARLREHICATYGISIRELGQPGDGVAPRWGCSQFHRIAYSAVMPATAKICGLSTPETLDAAIAGGARHVGLVFFAPSQRNLSFRRAAELAARVPSPVAKVGVFVDPDDALLDQAIDAASLDVIQLHRVAPDRAAAIRARLGLETWAAVAVKTRADLDVAHDFAGAADRILYDAKTPPGAPLPGGMGMRFDWTLLDGFRHPLPWILSGGLDAGNVAEAVTRTGAAIVDISSGVETAPGIKDAGLIEKFLKAVAAA